MKKSSFQINLPWWKVLQNSRALAHNPIPFHRQWFQTYGNTLGIKFINGARVMLTRDPEVIMHVLRKNHRNYHKSDVTTYGLGEYIGYGLLTLNGEEWKKDRRLLQPGFYKKRIEDLYNTTIPQTVQKKLDEIPLDTTIDIKPYMNELAFEVVTNALFDIQIEAKVLSEIRTIIDEIQLFFVKEVRQPQWNLVRKLSGQKKQALALVARIRELMNGFIEARIASDSPHNDLLDLMLQSRYEDGSPMERHRIIDELIILIVAGHETTANALSFMIHYLAKNPEIVDQLHQEIQPLEASALSPYEQLSQTKYGQAVVQETLRKCPPAWIVDRKALTDDSIGDLHIPKNALIGLSIYELHHNPEFWEEPELFKPERFLSSPPPVYIPFGSGPRMCIGNHFALFEMVEILRQMVLRFRWETPQEHLEETALITLQPTSVKVYMTHA